MITRRLAVYTCTIGLLAAQQPSAPPAGQPEDTGVVIRTTTKYVLAPVTVTSRDGSYVSGLIPEDFRLYDNNKLQRITEDQVTHPVSLVVVIQANGATEKVLPQIKKLGTLLESNVLGENGEVAVICFDHRIQTLTDFTSEPGKVGAALAKLKPGSWSSRLNDATMAGVRMLKSRPATRRRAMLIISEAHDVSSELNAREVLSEAEFSNVIIYSVNMSHLITSLTSHRDPGRPDLTPPGGRHLPNGEINTPTTESQQAMGNWVPVFVDIFTAAKGLFIPNSLAVFTRYSGGREESFMTQGALEHAVSDIGEELHSQYLLTYSPNNQDEPGFHQIIVTVGKPGLKVRTRDGYYLAGKPE